MKSKQTRTKLIHTFFRSWNGDLQFITTTPSNCLKMKAAKNQKANVLFFSN
jgi:hypothetical protein